MKRIYVVGAILICEQLIYCVQRGPGRQLAYKWEFPGGKIETGETPQEALQRELKEELKLNIDVTEPVFTETEYAYDFGIVNLKTIKCYLTTEEPILTEHINYRWLPVDELKTLDWAPADISTIDKLLADR